MNSRLYLNYGEFIEAALRQSLMYIINYFATHLFPLSLIKLPRIGWLFHTPDFVYMAKVKINIDCYTFNCMNHKKVAF